MFACSPNNRFKSVICLHVNDEFGLNLAFSLLHSQSSPILIVIIYSSANLFGRTYNEINANGFW